MTPKHFTSDLEKESLEAHVDLCALRYENLDERLTKIEAKVEDIHNDIKNGNESLIRVVVGAVGTVVAGLLSTIVVLLVNF
jgi:tetrahydromethanopterin S-methyltransferase subunit G